MINVAPIRTQSDSSWREGENEVVIINKAFNDARQHDMPSPTHPTHCRCASRKQNQATDAQYGPKSQYRLRSLIDNHAHVITSAAATSRTYNMQESNGEMQAPWRLPEDDADVMVCQRKVHRNCCRRHVQILHGFVPE